MATATSLTLRALLSRAAAVIDAAHLPPVTAGLAPPAKALAAVLAARAFRGVTLLVVPTDRDVDQMVADARFFHAALEGASGAAVEQAVLPFPSHQVDPYRGMTPHFRVAAARARALHAAATGSAGLLVASAPALLPRVSPPERLVIASREIRTGRDIDPGALAELLADAGYTREDPVDEHGSFAMRGGIVDVFLPADTEPVRIEFVGDMVESIRRFDPSTQRSTTTIDQLEIVPVRERFDMSAGDASHDDLEPGGDPDDWRGGPADSSLDDGWPDDDVWDAAPAPSEPSRGRRMPDVSPRQEPAGVDLVGVLDFVASCAQLRVLISEYDQVEEAARRQLDHLASSHADAAERGHVAALPPELAFTSWGGLARRLGGAPRLDELAIDEDLAAGDAHAASGPLVAVLPPTDPGPPPLPAAAVDPGPPSIADAEALAPAVAPRRRGSGAVRHVRCQPAREFHGRIGDWVAAVREARGRGDTVLFVAASAGRAERTIEILRDYEIVALPVEGVEDAHAATVLVASGVLSRGFRLPDAALQLYAETDVFDDEHRPAESRRQLAKTFLADLRDLKVGDLVVHVDHGIGAFVGLKQLGTGGGTQEFLELRYHGDDKLFVPVERLDLVQQYTGGTRPALDRLGGTTWEKAKSRVKKAMRDMAEELLKLYAQRRAVPGHAFAADSHWQEEFEGAFPYDPTADQASAIADIKRDMEAPRPMDRLLCGDVGYGKTEVAMRAAFKVVMDGKQVAFLAPTTVLAFQHLKTLGERFAGFPVTVDMVSRFRTRQEVKDVLAALALGRVDIIVGTHRLLSKDVQFKDLGLLVVDEEQRFGVAHKERIKQMRRRVDVLTMTATPIPRTLNMSLVGIRDMSVIETPPKDRLSIQTSVVKFDAPVIERAIRNELARGGQVYFVHNRVESIFSIGSLLQRLVPEARIAVAHGQMREDELERAMLAFVERRCDILLATTIVENGLDIPNANTMIINRADRYGLAQLYQLRGRVGRSDRPAYAYLLIPPQESLSPVARKRLAAIREFSDLGSGFRVAALDLEIRGAGNLLGGEQSGHIDAVGFEMYMKLLEETIRELKGEEIEDDVRATVNVGVDVRIADSYIPDMNQRLMVYRKVAAAHTLPELQAAVEGVRDRYGAPPPAMLNLAALGRIRILADRVGVESIDREKRLVVIRFRPTGRIDPTRLVTVVRQLPGAVLVPPASLKLDLDAPVAAPRAAARTLPTGARTRAGARGSGGTSWWTARATSWEVTSGFSKEEVLRQPDADPHAEGGLFARLETVLTALSDDARS